MGPRYEYRSPEWTTMSQDDESWKNDDVLTIPDDIGELSPEHEDEKDTVCRELDFS